MLGFSTLRKVPAPTMTLDTLFEAVESIEEDWGLHPTLVCLDYLQLIPNPGASDKIDQVAQAIVNAKMLGMKMDVPFVLGAQASRRVDGYGTKLPAMSDVQWTSQAEQHTDKLFGLWRPAQTEPLDRQGRAPIIEVDGREYECNEGLLVLRMIKQRHERGRHTWGMHLAPELLRLTELETRILNHDYQANRDPLPGL
jgi:replicative DNA helicase